MFLVKYLKLVGFFLLLLISILLITSCNSTNDDSQKFQDFESIRIERRDFLYENMKNFNRFTKESTEQENNKTIENIQEDNKSKSVEIVFAGDILLADNVGNAISRLSLKEMFAHTGTHTQDADIFIANLENPISTRGIPEDNKQYLFRAKPESVEVLNYLDLDVAILANNHILDFGHDALLDTIDILNENNIKYSGAGKNYKRAIAPIYLEKNGLTIAVVSSSHVVPFVSWYATYNTPGVTGVYDPSVMISSIKKASENADLVISYLHWGVELEKYPEEYQKTLGRKLIDAGSNIVVGCHSHVLQGIEYYNDGVIAYSLGNFIFTNLKRDTMNLKVTVNEDSIKKVQVIPYEIINYFPNEVTDKVKKNEIFKKVEEISWGISIDEYGFVLNK